MTNKIKNIQTIFFFLSFSAMLFACNKKSTNDSDITKPIITVAEPTANDTLSMAVENEVHVEFTTTDEKSLESLSVYVVKNGTDTLMNEQPNVSGLTVYAFHQHLMLMNIATVIPMKAILRAEDKSGNIELKTIDFFVAP